MFEDPCGAVIVLIANSLHQQSINRYVNELKSYIEVFKEPLHVFVLDTVFWQKPLRSAFLCVSWQFLVVRPTYIPGFCVFCLLIVNYYNYLMQMRGVPAIFRSTPIYNILMSLAVNLHFRGIDAKNEDKDHPYLLNQAERQLKEREFLYNLDGDSVAEEKADEEADDAKKEDVGKKKTTRTFRMKNVVTNLNPMAYFIKPIQEYLDQLCMQVRTMKNLLTWEDPFVSFWAMAVLFGVFLVATIFPYAFFFFWVFRLGGLALFGPQNRLLHK